MIYIKKLSDEKCWPFGRVFLEREKFLQTSCMAVVVIDDEDIRNAGKNSIS
jgi:hypothetical protein